MNWRGQRAPFVLLVRAPPALDCGPQLDLRERERLSEIRHPATARRRAFGIWLRRQVLGEVLGESPSGLRFAIGEHGRPALIGAALDFNLSHTADHYALAVADSPVGVDLETCTRVRDWPALAAQVLDAHEHRRAVQSTEPLARELIRYWTLKEAWLKGLGLGISGGLQATGFRFGGGRVRGRRDDLPARHGRRFGQRWIDPQTSLAWALADNGRRRVALLEASVGSGPAGPRLQLP